MPHRIQFHPLVPLNERPRIARGLVAIADAGYEVTVEPPDSVPALGWSVRLDEPGRTRYFRSAAETPDEWRAFAETVVHVVGPARSELRDASRARRRYTG